MNTLSAILWNPDIEIFSIFGISIRYYSVLFVTGLSLAYWVIYKLYQDQKIPYEKFDSLFVYCLLGIVTTGSVPRYPATARARIPKQAGKKPGRAKPAGRNGTEKPEPTKQNTRGVFFRINALHSRKNS